jgi:hypothetical protein
MMLSERRSPSRWHHMSAMPHSPGENGHNQGRPLLPVERLVGVIREAVLPSVESLIALKTQGKVLTGGYPIGQGAIVFNRGDGLRGGAKGDTGGFATI